MEFAEGFPSELVLFRELQDEAVLLDMRGEHYHGLNEVGTAVWTELVTSDSIATAVDTLLQQYDVPHTQLEADTRQLLGELLELGLVVIEPTIDSQVA